MIRTTASPAAFLGRLEPTHCENVAWLPAFSEAATRSNSSRCLPRASAPPDSRSSGEVACCRVSCIHATACTHPHPHPALGATSKSPHQSARTATAGASDEAARDGHACQQHLSRRHNLRKHAPGATMAGVLGSAGDTQTRQLSASVSSGMWQCLGHDTCVRLRVGPHEPPSDCRGRSPRSLGRARGAAEFQ